MKEMKPQKLIIQTQNHVSFINYHDIIYCKSDSCYTTIYLSDGETLLICNSLTKFSKRSDGYGFVRVSQSYLVNTNYIKTIDKKRKNILMVNKLQIPFTISIREMLELMGQGVCAEVTSGVEYDCIELGSELINDLNINVELCKKA